MGLLNWLTGDGQRQQEAERERLAQLAAEQAAARLAEQQRQAEVEQKIQVSREKAAADRQQKPGPAERAFPELATELRAEIRGERQPEPKRPPEAEATRHEHEFRPPGNKPVPVMGVAGVKYVNTRVAAPAPARTADDLLKAGDETMKKREAGMTPEQLRQHWGRFLGDRNPDDEDPRGKRS